MKIIALTILISLISLNQIAYSQTDAKAKKILDKVAAKAKTFKNMKYKFSYRMLDKAHNIDNSIEGSIVMQADKYNLHIMGRNVISDGKTVWTHDPDAEEIQISNAADTKNAFNFMSVISKIDDDYKAKYIKTIKTKDKQYIIIDLTPKKGESFYKIRLKIDKVNNWISEAKIYEKDNVTYTFTVLKFETNLKLPKNYFIMNTSKYPDSEVVDLR